MTVNLEQLRAFIARNKVTIGVLGAGAVALLALRSRSNATSSTGLTDAPTYSGTVGYSSGSQTSGATGYDSTASDVYNAIQPQIEELQGTAEWLRERWDAEQADTPPTPVPTPVPAGPKDYGDARRNAIANIYRSVLGREPDRVGLNAQDASGLSIDQLRANILRSPEATGRK